MGERVRENGDEGRDAVGLGRSLRYQFQRTATGNIRVYPFPLRSVQTGLTATKAFARNPQIYDIS